MKYIKLNKNWNAAPLSPDRKTESIENGMAVSFVLDEQQFEHIDMDDRGRLEFYDVYAWRWVPVDEPKKTFVISFSFSLIRFLSAWPPDSVSVTTTI